MSSRIDLVCINKEDHVEWTSGVVYDIAKDVADLCNVVDEIKYKTNADWVLFWDYANGQPDMQLINELSGRPVDVFHAGLKLGIKGLPDVLNYVHPAWMYNIDGSEDVAHTNFRLSFSACMIRVGVLRLLGAPAANYKSWEMMGVSYGYEVLRSGGVIRYQHDMINDGANVNVHVPLFDEWVFARRFFEKRWQVWTLLNKGRFFANLNQWLKTENVKYRSVKPALHPSEKTTQTVERKSVSVLAPTLDRYPYLEEELRELNEQTILPHEVLITDQTDKESRQEIDFSKYPNIMVKYFPQDDKGQCLAWNKLISEATGEYVFFFGDDAYDIKPDLIEKMLQTMQRFDADMVASNVREKGIVYGKTNYHYRLSDTFPITLIKKSVVDAAGGMDMFFNRNVKADHDLAMRCQLNGALMIFDPSAEIGHHRAPSGGLRAHNARVVTNFMAKNTLTKIINPSSSEIFIYKRYYTDKQYKQHVRIKYMNQVLINGNILKRMLRIFVMLYKLPYIIRGYKANLRTAEQELQSRGLPTKK